MVDFSGLVVGETYDRPYLANLWGYQSFNALSRGVFTPQNQHIIVLFITKEKQISLTQYEDHIEQDVLFWEGEKGHASDKRIIARQDTIHVFYREKHHTHFTYEGITVLNSYHLFQERPSKFTFLLVNRKITDKDIVAEVQQEYGLDETEKIAIINARIGQGQYRQHSIRLWHECSLTGFTKTNILIASHIKPWKISNNEERVNPYNSLLLIPTVDRLFDKGYIGFDTNGKILLSDKISLDDYRRINLSPELKLRVVPERTKSFLDYHCEYVFDLVDN